MPVATVVVLMLENRSFDHMLGMRPGVNGLLLPNGQINPKYANAASTTTAGSKSYAVTADAPYAVDPEDVYKSGSRRISITTGAMKSDCVCLPSIFWPSLV